MKTKFILHGGYPFGEIQINDNFFGEILKDSPNQSKILLVYFANKSDNVERYKTEDMEQLKSSDIVYFRGGHSDLILDKIKKYSNLDKLFKGKTIAGDSAGANVLVKTFYSKSLGVTSGLGILPIKLICHYHDDLRNKLDTIDQDLETIFLKEYQYKVILI